MLEIRKLPIASRNSGLGSFFIYMASSKPKNSFSCFDFKAKLWNGLQTVSGTTTTTFSIKIDNSVTSHYSKWGLVASLELENTLLRFNVKIKTWRRIKAVYWSKTDTTVWLYVLVFSRTRFRVNQHSISIESVQNCPNTFF